MRIVSLAARKGAASIRRSKRCQPNIGDSQGRECRGLKLIQKNGSRKTPGCLSERLLAALAGKHPDKASNQCHLKGRPHSLFRDVPDDKTGPVAGKYKGVVKIAVNDLRCLTFWQTQQGCGHYSKLRRRGKLHLYTFSHPQGDKCSLVRISPLGIHVGLFSVLQIMAAFYSNCLSFLEIRSQPLFNGWPFS